MEPNTYFIISAVLFLTALGAAAPFASAAALIVAGAMLCGGLFTKFAGR